MDYTKPLTEIKQNFQKLILAHQWEELLWLHGKSKAGNENLKQIFMELIYIYYENLQQQDLIFEVTKKS